MEQKIVNDYANLLVRELAKHNLTVADAKAVIWRASDIISEYGEAVWAKTTLSASDLATKDFSKRFGEKVNSLDISSALHSLTEASHDTAKED